jgi:prephenate dehydrogenase
VRQRFLADRVAGLDHDPAALDAAQWLGIIDEAHLQPGEWLADADLVILSAPVRTLGRLAASLEPFLSPETIITDVGGVKAELVRALSHLRFVGGHPMAGSERFGVVNADAALLENAVWVLTPVAGTDTAALGQVEEFITQLGAKALQVAPEQHDRLVAAVSHVPYLTSLALTHLVARDQDHDLMMLLAAGGFRDLTRVASGSPRMSRDMVVGNRDAVRSTLANLGGQLQQLAELLDDPDALLDAAEAAKRTRDSLPIVRRSLLPARFEITIAVPDQPGQLAIITNALGDAAVNIKDIEVLGIREAGGAVRLAFDDEDGLQRGSEALRAKGYEVRGRNGG